MPFTVIVLKKVPNSLRGDLTRWMQEIATGVYVGSYNSKVREYLWKRVTDTVGQGEASMCYACRNEIGYSFCTCNTDRQVVDYDGIPLVLIPAKDTEEENIAGISMGFSNANKFRHACQMRKISGTTKLSPELNTGCSGVNNSNNQDIVFLDIETTGLDAESDQIIEIGAIKISKNRQTEFHRLINSEMHIPDIVQKLTGITEEMLKTGSTLEDSIRDFDRFIQSAVLIGYNVSFDIKFLNRAFERMSLNTIHNKTLDLLREAKRKNCFQDNYKFETTLKEYGIDQSVFHRALEDAKLVQLLYNKMGFVKKL